MQTGVLRPEWRGKGRGIQVALETGKGKEVYYPLKPPEGTLACQQPDFRLLTSRTEENKFVWS